MTTSMRARSLFFTSTSSFIHRCTWSWVSSDTSYVDFCVRREAMDDSAKINSRANVSCVDCD